MRWLALVLLSAAVLLALPFCCSVAAYADETEQLTEGVSDTVDELDLTDFSEVASDYIGSVADKILALADGQFDDLGSFLQVFAEVFLTDFTQTLPSLLTIFAVAVIYGLCRRTGDGLLSAGTNDIVVFVGVAVICITLAKLYGRVYSEVYAVVNKIAAISQTSSPVMLTLLVACGGNGVTQVCRPGMVIFGSTILSVVKDVVLPLGLFGSLFAVAGNLSGSMRVEKLSDFFASTSGWVLGVVFMVYSAYTSVCGITAGAVDGVSVRAAKFAARNYIPILGGYLSEGFDVVLASANVVKNCFGAVTLAVLLLAVIKPICTTLCVSLGLQAVSAVVQPVADERTVKLLYSFGKTLSVNVVVVCASAFMFALQVVIAISCVNLL